MNKQLLGMITLEVHVSESQAEALRQLAVPENKKIRVIESDDEDAHFDDYLALSSMGFCTIHYFDQHTYRVMLTIAGLTLMNWKS